MTGSRRNGQWFDWRTHVGVLLVVATIASCGGDGDGGDSSGAASDTAVDDEVDTAITAAPGSTVPNADAELTSVADAALGQLDGLDDDAREALAQQASTDIELAGLAVGGLEDELGGSSAAAAAYAALVDPYVAAIAAERAAGPAGFRRQADQPSAGGLLFGGYMIAALGAAGVVGATNGGEAGTFDRSGGESGTTINGTGDVERAGFTATSSTTSDGLKADLKVVAELVACPAGDGTFQLTATIEAGVGSTSSLNGTRYSLDVTVDAQLGDDARLASQQVEVQTQAQKYEGSGGVFVDVTTTIDLTPGSTATSSTVLNRGAMSGEAPAGFVESSVVLGMLLGVVTADRMLKAVLDGIEGGRCVQLDATTEPAERSGVDPLTEFAIRAVPSSRVDGSSTGGTVTATLQGASSVEPSGTPVPADADFTYIAPGEPDSTGGVALEARSRRGVGRASLAFDTSGPQAYRIVGGLEDWQVDQVVCDITVPFTFVTDIGTMEMSGGLTGSYQASGMFGFSYTGTYAFDFPNGPDQPGTLVGGGGGVIAGQPGAGQESYTVTPVDC